MEATEERKDLPLLDALRILASVAVVRNHMRADFLFGVGFGLPLVLVIMFGLVVSSSKRESDGRFLRRKASYLLVPWLRWSLIYLVILAAADQVRGVPAWNRLEPAMMFYGGEKSLWFLPFAAAAMIPLKSLQRVAERWTPLRASVTAGALAVLATNAVAWALAHPLPDMPVRAWLRVSPAIFWGLAVGQSVRSPTARERGRMLAALTLLAVASSVLSPLSGGIEDLPRRFAVAVPLACLGFGWTPRVPSFVRRLSTATFGVYLVHPLIGKLLGNRFDVFAWPAWLHAGTVWCLAVLAVALLRRLPLSWHELTTGRGAIRAGPVPDAVPEKRAA
jgi:surface polysaccharide O-acyltransferase-like enzyme